MGSATMLLLLAATLCFASASLPILPRGVEFLQDKIYFDSTEALDWDQAMSKCQMGSNSTLLEITTEMQMAFIQMNLDVISNHAGANYDWWTAGTDVGSNRQWIWASTHAVIDEYVWNSGGPSTTDNYNCLSLSPSYDYLGINTLCEQSLYPICQLK